MRKITILMVALFVFTLAQAAPLAIKPRPKASEIFIPIGKDLTISLEEVAHIKVKDLELITGKKLRGADRILFKTAQKKLRNSIDTDGTLNNKKLNKYLDVEEKKGIHWGGFALGLFLNWLGVIIAYVITDEQRKRRALWAWIGFGAGTLLAFVIIGLAYSTSFD